MDRRLLSIPIIGMASVLMLLSCRASVPRPLSSDVVLSRSVTANITAPSRSFVVSGTYNSKALAVALSASGAVMDGGKVWAMEGSIALEETSDRAHRRFNTQFSIVTPRHNTSFLRFRNMSGMMADAIRHVVQLDAVMWNIGTAMSSDNYAGLTVDAASALSLLEGLTVDRDLGMTFVPSRGYQYHYVVRRDVGTPLSGCPLVVTGELWIDATTFLLQRAHWELDMQDSDKAVIDIHFGDDPPPLPIVTDASTQRLPLEAILDTLSLPTLLPFECKSGDTV